MTKYSTISGLVSGNTPWPKLTAAKQGLDAVLDSGNGCRSDALISMMNDASRPSDDALPSTGVPLELERLLSSRFVASDDYGTRNTSVLILNDSGELHWVEQNYSAQGLKGDTLEFTVDFPILAHY